MKRGAAEQGGNENQGAWQWSKETLTPPPSEPSPQRVVVERILATLLEAAGVAPREFRELLSVINNPNVTKLRPPFFRELLPKEDPLDWMHRILTDQHSLSQDLGILKRNFLALFDTAPKSWFPFQHVPLAKFQRAFEAGIPDQQLEWLRLEFWNRLLSGVSFMEENRDTCAATLQIYIESLSSERRTELEALLSQGSYAPVLTRAKLEGKKSHQMVIALLAQESPIGGVGVALADMPVHKVFALTAQEQEAGLMALIHQPENRIVYKSILFLLYTQVLGNRGNQLLQSLHEILSYLPSMREVTRDVEELDLKWHFLQLLKRELSQLPQGQGLRIGKTELDELGNILSKTSAVLVSAKAPGHIRQKGGIVFLDEEGNEYLVHQGKGELQVGNPTMKSILDSMHVVGTPYLGTHPTAANEVTEILKRAGSLFEFFSVLNQDYFRGLSHPRPQPRLTLSSGYSTLSQTQAPADEPDQAGEYDSAGTVVDGYTAFEPIILFAFTETFLTDAVPEFIDSLAPESPDDCYFRFWYQVVPTRPVR